jgi:hypothetical protein
MTLRAQAVAAGAIVSLGAVALFLVLLATGPSSGGTRPAAVAPEVAPPDQPASPAALPAASPATLVLAVPRAGAATTPFSSPTATPAVEVDPEVRQVQLPSRALSGLAASVAPCLRSGGLGRTSPTVMMLQLRASTEGVEVIRADVASDGGSDASLLACARDAVRGTRLEAMGLPPGELLATSWTVGTGAPQVSAGATSAVAPQQQQSSRPAFRRQRGKMVAPQ